MRDLKLRRLVLALLATVIVGCGSHEIKSLSPNSRAIAIKLNAACVGFNTSEVQGQINRAEELARINFISTDELHFFYEVQKLTHVNEWNRAQKMLAGAMGGEIPVEKTNDKPIEKGKSGQAIPSMPSEKPSPGE